MGSDRPFGIGESVALTAGSAVLWGLAHLITFRVRTGLILLATEAAAVMAGVVLVTGHRARLLTLAVQPGWLAGLAVGLVVLAVTWVGVIVSSYRLVRPVALDDTARLATTGLVTVMCVLVAAPTLHVARLAYVSNDLVTSLFAPGQVAEADPWDGEERLNLLLLGADAAPNRYGVRTDSITLASIDVDSGRTVLFGLPRNLEQVPMPSGPMRARFPYGFGGEPPSSPGLINEVFQYAEDHAELFPGIPGGRRGPALLKETVSGVLGLDVHYYAMVDMKGFAELIDAMGGVTVNVRYPIVYGRVNEGYIPAGTRKLSGEAALWYGRSRTDSDDYVRMSRQKCLLNALAKQADPATVLRGFDRLAGAAKRAVSTDIPQSLLPGLLELSAKVKSSKIVSQQFTPPLINTAAPDWGLIRRTVTETLDRAEDLDRAQAAHRDRAGRDRENGPAGSRPDQDTAAGSRAGPGSPSARPSEPGTPNGAQNGTQNDTQTGSGPDTQNDAQTGSRNDGQAGSQAGAPGGVDAGYGVTTAPAAPVSLDAVCG